MTAFVYILRCSDGTLYTGWTYDINKRIASHNSGTGAKYTRGRTPVDLLYKEAYETKELAMARESAIKALPREAKLELISKAEHYQHKKF
jgi:putative endonuclease